MLQREVREALNRASAEAGSNTPDHVLATYLMNCLEAFNDATNERDRWYGLGAMPAESTTPRTPEKRGNGA